MAVSQSVYMAGHLISALSMGAISDRYVRSTQDQSTSSISHVPFVFAATLVSNGQYDDEDSALCCGSVYSSLSRTCCLGPQLAVSDLTMTLAQSDLCLIPKLPAAGLPWTPLL